MGEPRPWREPTAGVVRALLGGATLLLALLLPIAAGLDDRVDVAALRLPLKLPLPAGFDHGRIDLDAVGGRGPDPEGTECSGQDDHHDQCCRGEGGEEIDGGLGKCPIRLTCVGHRSLLSVTGLLPAITEASIDPRRAKRNSAFPYVSVSVADTESRSSWSESRMVSGT